MENLKVGDILFDGDGGDRIGSNPRVKIIIDRLTAKRAFAGNIQLKIEPDKYGGYEQIGAVTSFRNRFYHYTKKLDELYKSHVAEVEAEQNRRKKTYALQEVRWRSIEDEKPNAVYEIIFPQTP